MFPRRDPGYQHVGGRRRVSRAPCAPATVRDERRVELQLTAKNEFGRRGEAAAKGGNCLLDPLYPRSRSAPDRA